jgi:hypothetical protein
MRARLARLLHRVRGLLLNQAALVERLDAIMSASKEQSALQAELLRTTAAMQREYVLAQPRAADPKRLLRYGYKGYSQMDEDGIIDEIFRRIGVESRYFVEFGVGNGLENNTVSLLLDGWRGAWLEGSAQLAERIAASLQSSIAAGQLRVRQAFVTAETIEALLAELGVPAEFDLLSIDIDGNDYWVWRAITRHRPRVVSIEYNAAFGRSARCTIAYRSDAAWAGDTYMGASLGALEQLGREKGYSLVGCNYAGTNAFFVRDDLVGDHFCAPFTAANHFETARYGFAHTGSHRPGWGAFEQV